MKDNAIAVFTQNGRFGLSVHGKELLEPEYDAIWQMSYGFWGARQAHRYLVVAPNGKLVVPACILPACFAGYRMLDLGCEDNYFYFREQFG